MRLGSQAFSPTNELTKVGKKQISETMTIFEGMSKPNHTMISGARGHLRHRLQGDDQRIDGALDETGNSLTSMAHSKAAEQPTT